MNLNSRAVLLTGASSGPGEIFCWMTYRGIADAVLAGRRPDIQEKVASRLRGNFANAVAVVVQYAQPVPSIANAGRQLGGVDVLMNSSRLAISTQAMELIEANRAAVVDTNFQRRPS